MLVYKWQQSFSCGSCGNIRKHGNLQRWTLSLLIGDFFIFFLMIFSLGPYCVQRLILHLNLLLVRVLSSQQTPSQALLWRAPLWREGVPVLEYLALEIHHPQGTTLFTNESSENRCIHAVTGFWQDRASATCCPLAMLIGATPITQLTVMDRTLTTCSDGRVDFLSLQ